MFVAGEVCLVFRLLLWSVTWGVHRKRVAIAIPYIVTIFVCRTHSSQGEDMVVNIYGFVL